MNEGHANLICEITPEKKDVLLSASTGNCRENEEGMSCQFGGGMAHKDLTIAKRMLVLGHRKHRKSKVVLF